MIYAPEFGSRPSTIVQKYAAQWRATTKVLEAERPEVVVVMTPPLTASLAALWYLRRRGGTLVLDAHSAAFLHPRWRHLQFLQRWLCRQACTTLVHNEHIAGLVRAAGAHTTLVPDIPIQFEEVEPFPRTEAFTVAVVCSFNADEPVAAIFAAARLTPEVRYFVTGNPKHLATDLRDAVPLNVTLTGFLSVAAYGGLLRGADVVLALTTRNHTMLRGAYEAIYQGTPVIVSDWPLLRDEFPRGAAHVANSADAIADGVRQVAERVDQYRAGAADLSMVKRARWARVRESLIGRLSSETPCRRSSSAASNT